MTLITQYETAVARGEIVDDSLQRDILQHFQRLTEEIKIKLLMVLSLRKSRVKGYIFMVLLE